MKYIKLFEELNKQNFDKKVYIAKLNAVYTVIVEHARMCIDEDDYEGFIYIMDTIEDARVFYNEYEVNILNKIIMPILLIYKKKKPNEKIRLQMLDYVLNNCNINTFKMNDMNIPKIGINFIVQPIFNFNFLKEMINRGYKINHQGWKYLLQWFWTERTDAERTPDLRVDDTTYWKVDAVEYLDWLFDNYPETIKEYPFKLPLRLENKYAHLKRGIKTGLMDIKTKEI